MVCVCCVNEQSFAPDLCCNGRISKEYQRLGLKMKCILLVDDDRDYLHMFGNVLLQEGFSVKFAASGEKALSILKDSTIHLMITDLNMPNMDGIELATKVAAIMPRLPIILHSGSISPDLPGLAQKAGIARVLAKPVRPGAMLEAIRIELEGI